MKSKDEHARHDARKALSKEELKHIADIARLELSEEELNAFSSQLEAVLEYFSTIQKYDTGEGSGKSEKSFTHLLKGEEPFREDTPSPSDIAELIVQNFSKRSGRFAKVVRGLKK